MVTDESTGSLSILNTGEGDIQVTFNNHDDVESERAIAMLLDMQKRGYAILVKQDDGTYQRAVAIDRETRSYVILPPTVLPTETPVDHARDVTPRKGRKKTIKQPIKGRRATAVARSAGGCAKPTPGTLLSHARTRST